MGLATPIPCLKIAPNAINEASDQRRNGRGRRGIRSLDQNNDDPATNERHAEEINGAPHEHELSQAHDSPTDTREAVRGRHRNERIKWTRELNAEVIRSFYYVNDCRDDPLGGWRHQLHNEFCKRHPELNLTEQNIVDRKNVIIRKGYLTPAEIANIRREVGSTLSEVQLNIEIENNASTDTNITTADANETETSFISNLRLYENMNPLTRPRLPKLIPKPETNVLIQKVNDNLRKYLEEVEDFVDVHTGIYAAAATILSLNNQNINLNGTKRLKSQMQTPAWKMRLEKEINKLRAQIDLIDVHLKGITTTKIARKICIIKKNLKIGLNDPDEQKKLTEYKDLLRQKAKAKGARLRRYNEATKRKTQNRLFQTNQRRFYTSLVNPNLSQLASVEEPNKHMFLEYWNSVWTNNDNADLNAPWLVDIIKTHSNTPHMPQTAFTSEDLLFSLKKFQNWKTPGPDQVQNFWLKRLTACHRPLLLLFNQALHNPTIIPTFLTKGVTYLKFKKGDEQDPRNYRPITCLSVFYKTLTSLISNKIYKHCENNKLIAFEQKGCIRKSLGCKEQLTVDAVIMEQVKRKKRNLFSCFIDYAKAFDSVPHNWLLKILEIYKISENIRSLLAHMIQSWVTTINAKNENLGEVHIKRGIFQGDSLSPIWFCLAMNPLSEILNQSNAGFRLKVTDHLKYSHLLFMDDLKLYSETKQQLESLINTTKIFNETVQMNFGIEKCAIIQIKKGNVVTNDNQICGIDNLDTEKTYKYLGIQQNRGIPHTALKAEFSNAYKVRLTKLLNSKLNAKNLITAINSWAVPSLIYTFGILKWSETDLDNLDRLTRRLLTKFRCLHPNSSIDRLYLARKMGGRGLLMLKNMCRMQEFKMKQYFQRNSHPNITHIVQSDKCFTPLNLEQEVNQAPEMNNNARILSWINKPLHGRYPSQLSANHINKIESVRFLTKGYLQPETEGFFMAIQDKVIRTKNYEKHILKMGTVDKCRKCNLPGETIEHITSGCPNLADNDYLSRHNQVAKIIHSRLATKYKLIKNPEPYYKYSPNPVLESNTTLLYWDRPILTDKTVDHNRPDILVIEKQNKIAYIIDIAVPLSHNILKTEQEKTRKYQNLSIEIKRIWRINAVHIIPLVISVDGIVPKNMEPNLKKIGLPNGLTSILQKAVILQTCHLLRKFVGV